MSAVIVHTDNSANQILVFGDADDFRLDEFADGVNLLHVLKGADRIATFQRWDSVAIVDGDAAELARTMRCAACDERAAVTKRGDIGCGCRICVPKTSDD